MGSLVVIFAQQNRADFIAALRSAGLTYDEFKGLPRHFHLPETQPDDLPSLPGVEIAEQDDMPVFGGADQAVSIDPDMAGGNYGILRTIRRRPPWNTSRLDYSFPLSSFYRTGTKTGNGVDIYMLDSGIRTTHDEFESRATNIYEYFSSGGLGDDQGHGTGMSACAAGLTHGIAIGANLKSYKCLDSSNVGTNLSVTSAISEVLTDYAASSNPGVVNMSVGGFGSAINSGVTDMIDAGLVVCASAGNDIADLATVDFYPAESDADVIVVGGIGPNDAPYYQSNFGSNHGTRVDVSAAAWKVETASNSGDSAFVQLSGTSLSTPLATGVVACLLQGEAKLTARAQVQAVRQFIIDSATTGYLQTAFDIILPDRILYLDPDFVGSVFD